MASNPSETIGSMAGVASVRTASQKAGWGIFGIGALFLFLMGWLSSWWVVPVIRQTGLEGLPGTAFFFFWQLAAPVGAFVVAIGAAFIGRVERSRPGHSSAARTGADFGMAGQVFYLIAAWYLCGLLGAPTFLLRPALAMTILPENAAISLRTTILICMALGSVFTFLSRRPAMQVKSSS